jgi:holo-[acyl-carrier protein] synthase
VRIIGHGVDLVEIQRLRELLARHPERFLERVFCPGERARGAGTSRHAEHLAARFAAKEAVLKALSTGTVGVGWQDIEVVSLESGAPTILLHGRGAEHARSLGITRWHVSLSHTRTMAIASVIATDE